MEILSPDINTFKGRRIISNIFASDIVGILHQILLSWTSALWTRLPVCGMSMESLCWNLSSLPAAPLDNVLPGHLHAGFLSLLGGANRCRGRCRGREGAPPSQELPPSIQHITPPCYSSPIVVSSPGLRRRLEVGTGSIKIPSIWSQDSQLTYCPQQIYTTRGALLEEENDENIILQRKGNKKKIW